MIIGVSLAEYATSVFPLISSRQPCQVKTAIFEPPLNVYRLPLTSSVPNISAKPDLS